MTLFVVIFSLILGIVVCQNDLREAYYQHAQRVSPKGFPCEKPQPRVVPVQEILETEGLKHLQNLIIRPHITVLNKCEAAGSCNKLSYCQAAQRDKVNRVFLVERNGKAEFENITIYEDVACSCQLDHNQPK